MKHILFLFSIVLFSCGSNNDSSSGRSIFTGKYEDGTYCADVSYHNPNTGTSNAYNNGLATGTNFTEDFKVRDYIISGNEKFIITDIANSNYMEINVSASQNYTDVPAYREIFV
jgi:hypothetical protein